MRKPPGKALQWKLKGAHKRGDTPEYGLAAALKVSRTPAPALSNSHDYSNLLHGGEELHVSKLSQHWEKSTNPRALLPYPHFLEKAKKCCKKGWRMNPSILQSWAELQATKTSRPAQKCSQSTSPSTEQVPGAEAGK